MSALMTLKILTNYIIGSLGHILKVLYGKINLDGNVLKSAAVIPIDKNSQKWLSAFNKQL